MCCKDRSKCQTKEKYEGHPESKELLRIQSGHQFSCSRALFLVFSAMLKSCLMKLYVGSSHGVSAERALAMGVLIENLADCEVRGVTRFLQADGILVYLAEWASSRVELFCCTTIHVRIMSGTLKPCCMSNSIGTSSSILRTVRTWHRRTF